MKTHFRSDVTNIVHPKFLLIAVAFALVLVFGLPAYPQKRTDGSI
jgi:hypothetical protein